MQADIVEAAQRLAVAQDDDRVVPDLRREELPVLAYVVEPSDELPGAREDPLALQLEEYGVVVHARRNRRRALDVRIEWKDERHAAAYRDAGQGVRAYGNSTRRAFPLIDPSTHASTESPPTRR